MAREALSSLNTLWTGNSSTENRLAESSSFKDVGRMLMNTRGNASSESLGDACATCECAVEYAKSRIQFGKSIASFQLVQNKLASVLTELTPMHLICFRTTDLQARIRRAMLSVRPRTG